MNALIEQTKKLIAHCGESRKDLKNQQSVFTQECVKMKEWQTDVGKEMLVSIAHQKALEIITNKTQTEKLTTDEDWKQWHQEVEQEICAGNASQKDLESRAK